MRRAWHITAKELLQNRRDPLATLFTVFLPVIFTVFLGLVISSTDRLPLALADSDGSSASQGLLQDLGEFPLLKLQEMEPGEVEDAVHGQDAAAGLLIPEGFGAAIEAESSVTLTFVRSETATVSQSVLETIESAVSDLNVSVLAGQTAAREVARAAAVELDDSLMATARSLVDGQLTVPVAAVHLTASGGATETVAGGFDQSSPGMIVNFVLFGVMGVAATTILERRRGLLRRLSVTGAHAWEVITGKLLAMFALTFLMQLLLVLVGQFALGVEYFSNAPALLATMVSLTVLGAAFGLLISTLFRSEPAVIATIVMSAMVLAALGGAWFPLEVTSTGFSKAAHFLPSAWIMDSFHGITVKGWGIRDILFPLGIVWAWIVAAFGIAIWRYRPD